MTELKPVQVEAKKRSRGRKGFGFFMEMGLGKSLTALSEWGDLITDGITRHVVICPNSFKGGWRDQVKEHSIDADVHIFESGGWYNASWMDKAYKSPPMLVVNYEAIRSPDTRKYITEFMMRKPTYLTIDESIQIKTYTASKKRGPDGKLLPEVKHLSQTKAALELAPFAARQRILSGKPQTQGPHDLWAQMQAIGVGTNRNYYAWRAMFCRMGGFKGKQVIESQNEDILARIIEPHVFYALKEDWGLDIPKIYTTREYEMLPEQKRQYKDMEKNFVTWLNETEYVTIEVAITKYIKMAQIQCGFILDDDGRVRELVPQDRNPRVKALQEIIENELRGKLIVVYWNTYCFHLLNEQLAKYNPAYIKGNMEGYELDAQKEKFRTDNSCRVILVQQKPGKYGHTLLGGPEPVNRCSTVVFFQNSYSLDDRSQVEDRPHRFGQTAESVLYIDISGSPLDRATVKSLQRKEGMYQAVFKPLKEGLLEL